MDFLCIQILNSNHIDSLSNKARRDLLDDEAWMRELLEHWHLEAPLPIPTAALSELKSLREQMYSILNGMSQNLAAVNQVLESVSTRLLLDVRQDGYHLNQIYDASGWNLVLWQITKSFADLLCNYDQSRIKLCDNPDCGWVFYDTSKNKSRRWCSDKTCGNVMKVRKFRERQKATE